MPLVPTVTRRARVLVDDGWIAAMSRTSETKLDDGNGGLNGDVDQLKGGRTRRTGHAVGPASDDGREEGRVWATACLNYKSECY